MAGPTITHTALFDSWGDYLSAAESSSSVRNRHSRNSEKRDFSGDAWAGGTWKDTIAAAHAGWSEVLPEVDAYSRHIATTVIESRPDIRFTVKRTVAGGRPNVPAMLAGHPANMLRPAPMAVRSHGRVARLVVQVGQAWVIDAKQVKARGVAVVALIDVLRAAGIPLEVWAVTKGCASGSSSSAFVFGSCIAEPHDPIDMAKVMFAVAHPGSFRRVGFSYMETCESDFRDLYLAGYGTYGPNAVLRESDLPAFHGITEILPLMAYAEKTDWTDTAVAAEWINGALDRIANGELVDERW
jgi:hypothetical protein